METQEVMSFFLEANSSINPSDDPSGDIPVTCWSFSCETDRIKVNIAIDTNSVSATLFLKNFIVYFPMPVPGSVLYRGFVAREPQTGKESCVAGGTSTVVILFFYRR